jgi:hypothetical protein
MIKKYYVENNPIIPSPLAGEGGGEGDYTYVHPHLNPPPSRDCVVIMMEGRFRWNRQSGSSALECGRLKSWVIGLLRNGILFIGLEPRS